MWAGRMVTAPHPLLLPTGHFPMGGNASCEALLPPPGLGLQPGCRPGEKIRRCIHKRSRNPSPAKQVRDATRQMLFLTRTAPGKDAKPAAESNERIGSVLASAVDSVLLGPRGVLHEAFLGCAGPIAGRMARCRNLFPLPLLTSWPDSIEVEPLIVDAALLLANVGIVSLNFLRCDFKISRLKGAARGPATAAQQEACNHIARRVERMLTRISGHPLELSHWMGSFCRRFEAGNEPAYEPLRSDAVDLPERAGTCNPVFTCRSFCRRRCSTPVPFSQSKQPAWQGRR